MAWQLCAVWHPHGCFQLCFIHVLYENTSPTLSLKCRTGCKCTITTTSTLSHKLWLCVNISVFDHAFAATVLSFHKLAEVLCVYLCLSVCLYLDGYQDNYTTESSSWQTDRNPDDKWLDKPCLQETHSHAYTVPQFIFSFLLCCLSFLTDPDFFLSSLWFQWDENKPASPLFLLVLSMGYLLCCGTKGQI